ncbi:hypothetical protein D4764_0180720 [Takifugu flavidus]|uniref:Platelet glycoprotein Ib alpha chain n=1 Tax=Takifugu flavidus TaxID=433684 RepID=A0A5C6MEL0_9TELE|nr:hypothetical protein D4764_0180720 [Takifugu flavidus]
MLRWKCLLIIGALVSTDNRRALSHFLFERLSVKRQPRPHGAAVLLSFTPDSSCRARPSGRMALFVVVLLWHVGVVTGLAGCHGDRDKDDRPRQNCAAAGFREVPEGLTPSAKVLLFPNNLFPSLTWSSFQGFTELYEIDLTGNQVSQASECWLCWLVPTVVPPQVPQVPPSAAPVLPTLGVLRLGSNLLTSLPDRCFSACPGLIELYLNNNSIQTLRDRTFSGLHRLEVGRLATKPEERESALLLGDSSLNFQILELSSNRIQVLPELLLHPLPAIESLYLENNKIQVMPDDWFSQKEEVPYLFLSANPWACSCSLGYLHRYVDEYDFNIYTRSGPLVTNDPDSVVRTAAPLRTGSDAPHTSLPAT